MNDERNKTRVEDHHYSSDELHKVSSASPL